MAESTGPFSAYVASVIIPFYLSIRLLLHSETPDGSVIPVWEEVRPGDIAVLKDVMNSRRSPQEHTELHYTRVPITAEKPPDFTDFNELIGLALSTNMAHTPIVVNDQLGLGRSTLTSVSSPVAEGSEY